MVPTCTREVDLKWEVPMCERRAWAGRRVHATQAWETKEAQEMERRATQAWETKEAQEMERRAIAGAGARTPGR